MKQIKLFFLNCDQWGSMSQSSERKDHYFKVVSLSLTGRSSRKKSFFALKKKRKSSQIFNQLQPVEPK